MAARDGSGMSPARLAIFPGVTHYTIFHRRFSSPPRHSSWICRCRKSNKRTKGTQSAKHRLYHDERKSRILLHRQILVGKIGEF